MWRVRGSGEFSRDGVCIAFDSARIRVTVESDSFDGEMPAQFSPSVLLYEANLPACPFIRAGYLYIQNLTGLHLRCTRIEPGLLSALSTCAHLTGLSFLCCEIPPDPGADTHVVSVRSKSLQCLALNFVNTAATFDVGSAELPALRELILDLSTGCVSRVCSPGSSEHNQFDHRPANFKVCGLGARELVHFYLSVRGSFEQPDAREVLPLHAATVTLDIKRTGILSTYPGDLIVGKDAMDAVSNNRTRAAKQFDRFACSERDEAVYTALVNEVRARMTGDSDRPAAVFLRGLAPYIQQLVGAERLFERQATHPMFYFEAAPGKKISCGYERITTLPPGAVSFLTGTLKFQYGSPAGSTLYRLK